MISADLFVSKAQELGFSLYAGVPCSYLKSFINYTIESDELRYVGAVNEGDAVAIAAGAQLGGKRAIVMLQNSGLGNAVSPLTSLTYTFQIPILLIITLRGEPGGAADEPQHDLMGRATTSLLELMEIPWAFFPGEAADIESVLAAADESMTQTHRPFALVMRKGSVSPVELSAGIEHRSVSPTAADRGEATAHRREILQAIQSSATDNDVIIATTGYTGRELFACGDKQNQFYMVGSMGCASSLGLGLALAQPDRRIIVVDGDGAALMRLGAWCTIGYERPANLVHILLDNGIHESTGGQATVSGSIDFCALAGGAGYPSARSVSTPDGVASVLKGPMDALTFIHVPILSGIPDKLPRPGLTPAEVANRLRHFLQG